MNVRRSSPKSLLRTPGPNVPECALPAVAPQVAPAFLFEVDLPLPPKMLSPNVSAHWAVKARAVKKYREDCGVLVKMAMRKAKALSSGPAERAVVDIEYRCHRESFGYAAKDTQNAISALKAAIDGMVDAGVVKSDSAKRVSWGSVLLVTTKRNLERMGKKEGVTLTLRSA